MVHSQRYGSTRASDSCAEKSTQIKNRLLGQSMVRQAPSRLVKEYDNDTFYLRCCSIFMLKE